jgi:type II secretory pathway pseudopilin PulG
MAEEQKTSALFDPRFWLSILGFLWVVSSAAVASIWSKLDSINTAVQASAIANAAEAQKRAEMERRIGQLEGRVTIDESNQTAYNFDLSKQMTKLQAESEKKR